MRIAVVTGAGSGNGKAIATRLAINGAMVLLADIDETAARQVCADLEREGLSAKAHGCDVANAGQVETFAGWVDSITDHIDVLVNNAGIGRFGSIDEFTEDEWDLQMAVNARGVFLMTKALMPALRRGEAQSIINIGSGAGVVGVGNSIGYCASKGAVVAMSRSMAIDFASSGIRVNCLCPGVVDTPFNQRIVDEADDPDALLAAQRAAHPLGRLATAEDVANGVAFLASEQASFITGSTFMVDGGLTAQ